ncbi:MAG: hypothetical protein IKA62_08515 [Clostridia bacterium]|nr:hypothetical protein [Clostridia bacterium]
MKEYVFSILAVATVGALVLILSPEGEGGGIKKHISLAVGLAAILVIISPLTKAMESLANLNFEGITSNTGDADEYESIFYDALNKAEISNLKSGIKAALRDKFDIDESECSVEITLRDNKIRRVLIRLYGSAVWCDSGAIEKYLYELLGCEIVTAIN